MFRIIYSEKVKINLKEIEYYISIDDPIYGMKTINSILKTIELLETFPFIGKNMNSGYRLILEQKYKFKIVYKNIKGGVYIVSIFKYKNTWK